MIIWFVETMCRNSIFLFQQKNIPCFMVFISIMNHLSFSPLNNSRANISYVQSMCRWITNLRAATRLNLCIAAKLFVDSVNKFFFSECHKEWLTVSLAVTNVLSYKSNAIAILLWQRFCSYRKFRLIKSIFHCICQNLNWTMLLIFQLWIYANFQ